MSAAQNQIRVGLLTFNDAERSAVDRYLSQHPKEPTSGDRLIDDGRVAHLHADSIGNIPAAAYIAHQTMNAKAAEDPFNFIVAYGCSGCTDTSQERGSVFLVDKARYVEVGRIEDPLDARSTESVRLKRMHYRSRRAQAGFPLAHFLHEAVGIPLARAFTSEKTVHVDPLTDEGPDPKHAWYREALAEWIKPFALLEMEARGLVAGAPGYQEFMVLVRVVTDYGSDKKDQPPGQQEELLRQGIPALDDVLRALVNNPPLPPAAVATFSVTGGCRHSTRMESDYEPASIVERILGWLDVQTPVGRRAGLEIPGMQENAWLSDQPVQLAEWIGNALDPWEHPYPPELVDGYPVASTPDVEFPWWLMVEACEQYPSPGYGLLPTRDELASSIAEADERARAVREGVLESLRYGSW